MLSGFNYFGEVEVTVLYDKGVDIGGGQVIRPTSSPASSKLGWGETALATFICLTPRCSLGTMLELQVVQYLSP